MRAIAASAFFAFLATSALSAPRILMVPIDDKANTSLGNYLCNEFNQEGRMEPIAWGFIDPTFRAAALEGKLGSLPETPSLKDAIEAAKGLKAEYVLMYATKLAGTKIKAHGDLYVNGRKIWTDEQNVSASVSAKVDEGAALATVARTWILMLGTRPLKSIPIREKAVTPEAATGQAPVIVTPAVVAKPAATPEMKNQAIREAVDAQIKAGKSLQAEITLRDAIDQDPLDLERRNWLVDLLLTNGSNASASLEARRAAKLVPDSFPLWKRSIEASIVGGQVEAAASDLQETMARHGALPEARLLAAEVAIAQGRGDVAINYLEDSLRDKPTADVYVLRAIARALLGGVDGVEKDFGLAAKLPALPAARATYIVDLATRAFDSALNSAFANSKTLIQRASIRPDSRDLKEALDTLMRQAQARSKCWSNLAPNKVQQPSYDRWGLAQKLYLLSLLDLDSYIKSGGDALTDSRINLGEAMKQATTARTGGSLMGGKNERAGSR